MKRNARVADLILGTDRGRPAISDDELAANFSFVLHESSSSSTVRRAVAAARRHRRRRVRESEVILDGETTIAVDAWLTASIGFPEHLRAALSDAGCRGDPLFVVDRRHGPHHTTPFFRSEATLALPFDETPLVGVVALVMRPGVHAQQLILRGPFDWQTHRADAMRALEAIIQAHIGQWLPERRLWPDPAEIAFPEEVL